MSAWCLGAKLLFRRLTQPRKVDCDMSTPSLLLERSPLELAYRLNDDFLLYFHVMIIIDLLHYCGLLHTTVLSSLRYIVIVIIHEPFDNFLFTE